MIDDEEFNATHMTNPLAVIMIIEIFPLSDGPLSTNITVNN